MVVALKGREAKVSAIDGRGLLLPRPDQFPRKQPQDERRYPFKQLAIPLIATVASVFFFPAVRKTLCG